MKSAVDSVFEMLFAVGAGVALTFGFHGVSLACCLLFIGTVADRLEPKE